MSSHICPWWMGYFLANPLRRLFQNPYKILSPFIKQGMFVIDIGTGMGYFSIPLARMTGESGKVVCVDIQRQMLSSLEKKARRKGVLERIETILCRSDSLCLEKWTNKIDFVLVFAVVHEAEDKKNFFLQACKCMKGGGKMLFAEPKGRVTKKEFDDSLKTAEDIGLKFDYSARINRCHSVLLIKV